MWLADLGTAFAGVLFLVAPSAAQSSRSPAEAWSCVIGGVLLLLMDVVGLDRDEYQRPWYAHFGGGCGHGVRPGPLRPKAARPLSIAHGVGLLEGCGGADDLNSPGHAEDWRSVMDVNGPVQELNGALASDAAVPASGRAEGAAERAR